jgi:hypothetical protein
MMYGTGTGISNDSLTALFVLFILNSASYFTGTSQHIPAYFCQKYRYMRKVSLSQFRNCWVIGKEAGTSIQYKKPIFVDSVVDPKLFFSDPEPIFVRVLDPDPLWLTKSYGSSFESDHRYSFFHNANNKKKKSFSWHFKDPY